MHLGLLYKGCLYDTINEMQHWLLRTHSHTYTPIVFYVSPNTVSVLILQVDATFQQYDLIRSSDWHIPATVPWLLLWPVWDHFEQFMLLLESWQEMIGEREMKEQQRSMVQGWCLKSPGHQSTLVASSLPYFKAAIMDIFMSLMYQMKMSDRFHTAILFSHRDECTENYQLNMQLPSVFLQSFSSLFSCPRNNVFC